MQLGLAAWERKVETGHANTREGMSARLNTGPRGG